MVKSDIKVERTGPESSKTFSKCQWWLNWITIIFIQVLVSVTYGVVMPSMHQFVTNRNEENEVVVGTDNSSIVHYGGVVITSLHDRGRNFSDNSNSSESPLYNPPHSQSLLWPGLSQSEFLYSWVVTVYSIGELVGAFLGGFLSSLLSYRFNIFFANIVLIIGGSVYALTIHTSMILTARFLMGVHCGYGLVLLTSYIGVTTDQLEAEKQAQESRQQEDDNPEPSPRSKRPKKKNTTLKDWLYGVYSLVLCLSYPATLGVCAVMSSFSHLNPFHWPGWFVVAMTVTYLVLFVLLFREDTPLFSRPTKKRKQQSNNQTRKTGFTCPTPKQILMYSILTVAGFMVGSLCTARDVLMNPLLGDQFGFRISDMSYFMLAIMSTRVLVLIFQLVVKFLSIPNRTVLIVVFVVAIVAGLLLSDWQSIGDDPCDLSESEILSLNLSNSTTPSHNQTNLEQLCLSSNNVSQNQCYWNQRSRITGQFCVECYPVCKSVQKSLNFVQFFVGLSLMSCVIPLGQVFVSVITSDYTPIECQGVMMGLIFAAAGLSRFVSPMLVDWAYEATDKHTYIPMSVMNFALLVMVVILLIVYKELAPKREIKSIKKSGNYALVVDLNTSNDNSEKDTAHELFINLNAHDDTRTSTPSQEKREEDRDNQENAKEATVARVEGSGVSVAHGGCKESEDVCCVDSDCGQDLVEDDDTNVHVETALL